MMTEVATVHPETDVAEAVKLLAEHDASALPVVASENVLVGILSKADLIEARRNRHRKAPAMVARRVLT
jgi:CBS domain-containing protein